MRPPLKARRCRSPRCPASRPSGEARSGEKMNLCSASGLALFPWSQTSHSSSLRGSTEKWYQRECECKCECEIESECECENKCECGVDRERHVVGSVRETGTDYFPLRQQPPTTSTELDVTETETEGGRAGAGHTSASWWLSFFSFYANTDVAAYQQPFCHVPRSFDCKI